MLRCCKRPSDYDGPLYDAVTQANSRYPHRAVSRAQDAAAERLPSRQPRARAGPDPARGRALPRNPKPSWRNPIPPSPIRIAASPPSKFTSDLRAALLPRFPWLDKAAPARIARRERASDLCACFGFLLVVLFALSLPGLLFVVFLRAFFPGWEARSCLLLLLLIAHGGCCLLSSMRSERRGRAKPLRPAPAGSRPRACR